MGAVRVEVIVNSGLVSSCRNSRCLALELWILSVLEQQSSVVGVGAVVGVVGTR